MSTSRGTNDTDFLDPFTTALEKLPAVEALALGGSRAQCTHHPDSDWDVAIYYRGDFQPRRIRELGWRGSLSEVGGWGPIFNGGGKLTIDDRVIDIHYRDLDLIDQVHDDACQGEFTIEPLMFHQAGIPTYILLAELGLNITLRGAPPQFDYPEALRRTAPPIWSDRAQLTLAYAEGHAGHGRIAQCAGLLSEAACQTAHALLAHRGEWITNEKQMLTLAGLRAIDRVIADLHADVPSATTAVQRARKLLAGALEGEGI
jgi:hypothetical protein